MSWRLNSGGDEDFSVFFNRDESKARQIAEPPTRFETEGGFSYLAPIDPQAGGTWMFCNEVGVVVTLLNWYDKAVSAPDRNDRFESRGLLVKGLADVRDLSELSERMAALDGAKYRPFHLLGFAPGIEPRGWSWDGEKLFPTQQGRVDDSTGLSRALSFSPPLASSSSFDTEAVLSSRRERFLKTDPESTAEFEAFQNNDKEQPTAYTPRMNRPDAQTWSRSRVDVSPEAVHFKYVAESPDLAGAEQVFEAYLPRS